MIATAILIILAAICNAVMDVVSHKYNQSIFAYDDFKEHDQFWDASISWRNKYIGLSQYNGRRKLFWNINYPVQITDAFHLFKMIMIFAFIGAIAICPTESIKESIIVFVVGGIIYNTTFSLFYKRILIKR